MTEYHTKSGSIYEVDHAQKLVRAKAKANDNKGLRLSYDWKPYETLDYHGVGHPLYFWWGAGLDEHSHQAMRIGDGDSVRRCTFTSPVVAIGE